MIVNATTKAASEYRFELLIEPPIAIAKRSELHLLRAAATSGASPELRLKLARLLFAADDFDGAIAIAETLLAERYSAPVAKLQIHALLARETPADNARAAAMARTTAEAAETPTARGNAFALLGKALIRMELVDEAREVLIAALAENPHGPDAFKRLAALELSAGNVDAVAALTDRLLANGVGHAKLLVMSAIVKARLGEIAEARATIDLRQFLYRETLVPPPGYETITALNKAVVAELARHPDWRYERYGVASNTSWRLDEPVIQGATALPALQRAICDAVTAYVASLDGVDTPWTRARRDQADYHNWCVMTEAQGFEGWHVHQNGWLSGVYYIDVPPAVGVGDGKGGCLVFGLPPDMVGETASRDYGEEIVRPYGGLLMLFPSHAYHRTFAHGLDHRRICLAFDIRPL